MTYNTKAAVALVVSVLIAGLTAANTQVSDHTWLSVITIALAAVNPVWVWATSNSKQSSPPAKLAKKTENTLP